MEWKNVNDGTILNVNRVIQDVGCITINVTDKKKGPSLDVYSSVNKIVVEFKADFFCPAHASFIAVVSANGHSRTLCVGRENV
jgi:hypothetical protein